MEKLEHTETPSIVARNLSRIRLIAVAGALLLNENQAERVLCLLRKRLEWGLGKPCVMLALHNDQEEHAGHSFAVRNSELAEFKIVKQTGHNETVGNAIALFRTIFSPDADVFTAKRQCVFLTRRGGKGKPTFISPFLGGQGTTCGEWTRPMVRNKDGSVLKGFMKAAVAVGFCPVECPYCYLNMPYTDGMDVALNWEDLKNELLCSWQNYQYPINFGETSGLIEYDEWFAAQNGDGSMAQFIIDACETAKVTPFFLTKIRYPKYLKFKGKVQVGISLMPEAVRSWVAPNGSPTIELLESLAWAVKEGAVDPVVRLTTIWEQIDDYPELLEMCKSYLGSSNWRLTLDILRFTPSTASTIAKRFPAAAEKFAREISADDHSSLKQLAKDARSSKEYVKKIRPSAERQAEIFRWFRVAMNKLGCDRVYLTPCKGDPQELVELARLKIINSMPCACYGCSNAKVAKENDQ